MGGVIRHPSPGNEGCIRAQRNDLTGRAIYFREAFEYTPALSGIEKARLIVNAARIRLIVPVLFIVLIFGSPGAFASDYEGVKVTLIKKATTAANGQKLAYAASGNPEVTA